MAKVISSVEFAKVFAKLATEGKSAADIGKALNMKGDAEKVALAVSARASQLRKKLKEGAVREASAKGLSAEETAALVKAMENKLPRIKSRGRKSNVADIVSAIDSVLAELNGHAE